MAQLYSGSSEYRSSISSSSWGPRISKQASKRTRWGCLNLSNKDCLPEWYLTWRYEILLISSSEYQVLSDPLIQLQYLTKLLGRYSQDKHVQIMLDGFLDNHRNTCKVEDCPSKKRTIKTTKFTKTLRNEKVSEQLIIIYLVVQTMYYLALQRFPNST